jgi:Alginate export
MKGDSGTSLVNCIQRPISLGAAERSAFSLVVDSQLDLQHRRLDASCRRRGSGRLVSVREGPNVRQTFDGVKIRSKVCAWNVDAWAVRPDLDRHGFFDDAPDHTTSVGSCGRATNSEDKRRVS